ncbi:unnamed protein product [Brassica napus]|uniref:(rape) hypothetical protein n=1 Tax=Brassica napus TaxID=3708 RepID=A0A816L4D1_BRANA|nr:unnamed protein product [Brassica napus]
MRFALGLIEWLCLFINQRLLHYLPARPLVETSITLFLDLLPDIPLWMKNPDYERLLDLLDDTDILLSTCGPTLIRLFARLFGAPHNPYCRLHWHFLLSPTVYGKSYSHFYLIFTSVRCIKFYETNEKELLFEPSIKWAGNPYIVLVSET